MRSPSQTPQRASSRSHPCARAFSESALPWMGVISLLIKSVSKRCHVLRDDHPLIAHVQKLIEEMADDVATAFAGRHASKTFAEQGQQS